VISDEALMLDFRHGSRPPFEELFARYREPLSRFFRRRLTNRERAEDLTQEAFIAVIRATIQYQPKALFRTYLYSIAFNLLAAEGCQECQRLAADFRGLSQQLARWQVEQPSPVLTNNIAAVLEQHSSQPWGKFAFLTRRQTWAWAGSLTIVALVGVFVIQPRPSMQYAKVSALRAPASFQIRDSNASTVAEFARAKNPMIMRTSQLTIAVKEFAKTRPILDEILKRHGGYLGRSNISSPIDSGPVLEAILRVPSDQFDAAMAELKALGRVESESQTGEEITQQYVDLEARLFNARNSEKRLTDLLRERTGKLADVLAVEKEIER
jgi:RNA polymerase sigma factor (sigma-70 family)